ncbi:MAG: glycine/betaine/sarcosine/D-proline family reductase selenoprotein B [Acidimicrobiales bacterium]|jgi:D-proline reductase (dithiol) PrdB|nr:glycine/betaine/sarcosine/D-proline family reductase selenoprotein B [Acidimicrobiales bacterium]
MSADSDIRAWAAGLPAPEFDTTAWTTPPPLAGATVAIVTTAALHRRDDEPFGPFDVGYRVIDRTDRDLVLGHWSPNFDREGFALDLDVVFPIDRLEELAADGTIGAVAPHHLAFAGNQDDTVTKVRLDTAPKAAQQLRHDGVDVVLLTPV